MSAFGGKADIALPVKMSANGKMNHAIDILQLDRRRFAIMAAGGFAAFFPTVRSTDALDAKKQLFIAEAARMKQEAIASGDQPFGAVVVVGDTIVWAEPRGDRPQSQCTCRACCALGCPTSTGHSQSFWRGNLFDFPALPGL